MQLSIQPEVCLTFPRLRNREQTNALIEQYLPRTYHVPITDPQRMRRVVETDPRLSGLAQSGDFQSVHRQDILIMIEAPAVQGLQYSWSHLMADIQRSVGKGIRSAMIVDMNTANARRLRYSDSGLRTDFTGGTDIDLEFHDENGPERLIREVRGHMPDMHIIPSTEDTLVHNITAYLQSLSSSASH